MWRNGKSNAIISINKAITIFLDIRENLGVLLCKGQNIIAVGARGDCYEESKENVVFVIGIGTGCRNYFA